MKKLISFTTVVLLFNTLFWGEQLGLNTLLFAGVIACSSFLKKTKQSESFYFSLAGLFLSSIFFVYNNSSFALTLTLISAFVTLGLKDNQIRFLHNAILNSLIRFIHFLHPQHFINEWDGSKQLKFEKLTKYLTLSVIPILILTVFLFIFISANPKFYELYVSFWDNIAFLLEGLSFSRLLFFIWSITIASWLVYRYTNEVLAKSDFLYKDVIERKSNTRNLTPFKTIDLKKEFLSSLILLVMVNLLLLIVNIIDINWVWINFEYNHDFNISQFVHEGTYLLIISVLLSIGILHYIFRRNLNFFSKSPILTKLAYFWIAQNIILVCSVGLRNLHYINVFGLSNKRIGVYIFLIITLMGLLSIGFKIKNINSFSHYLRTNMWYAYIILVCSSAPNWDYIISSFNLNSTVVPDYGYLIQLSDTNIPLLENLYANLTPRQQLLFDKKKQLFLEDYNENETWLSWDYASYKTFKYFTSKKQ